MLKDLKHREFNLAPILADKHKEKTAADRDEKSKVDRIRQKHLGIKGPKRAWPKRPFIRRSA